MASAFQSNAFQADAFQSDAGNALFPSLFVNSNTFYTPVVTAGAIDLQPSRYDNTNTFYSPTVVASNDLAPALYTNTNTFYAATVAATYALLPARFDNVNTFYTPTVEQSQALLPALFVNSQTFYTPTVTPGTVTLYPSLYTNTNQFFSPAVEFSSYTITRAQARLLEQIYKLNGLTAAPLYVNTNFRTVDDIAQTITEARNGTITVVTDSSMTYVVDDPGEMIEEIAALYALTDTLQVTRTGRFVGTLSQSIITDGPTTVVTRLS